MIWLDALFKQNEWILKLLIGLWLQAKDLQCVKKYNYEALYSYKLPNKY